LRKLFVSTLQSALFNAWLGDRIEAGELLSALEGDILRKEDSGGLFTCTDAALDSERVRSWEISATGPMFGARMRSPEATALARELALLERFGVRAEHFVRVERSGEGTRRPARVRVSDVEQQRDGEDLVLSFTLPKGSYATVLLAELTKTDTLTLGDDP
jgi:tRNA pseudouridine13 synthase